MRFDLLILSFILFNICSAINAQKVFYWGNVNANLDQNSTFTVDGKAQDNNKNIYIINSYYKGNYKIGSSIYTNLNSLSDACLIKLDKKGNILWHIVLKGTSTDQINAVSVDKDDNPIIIGCTASSDASFYQGTNNLLSLNLGTSIYRGFIAKLNKTSGAIISLSYISSDNGSVSTTERPTALSVNNGVFVISGLYRGKNTLLGPSTITSTSNGSYFDMYIIQGTIDELSNNFIFNVPIICSEESNASSFTSNLINAIKKTDNGYYFVGLIYNSNITFPLISGSRKILKYGVYDFFTYYTDLSLNGKWVLQSIGNTSHKLINGIAVDNLGNLFLTGYNRSSSFTIESINSSVILNSSAIVNSGAVGSYDDILLKYDSSGKLLNYKVIGNSSNQYGNDITLVDNNKIAISGYFYGSQIFANDTLNSSSGSDQDGFMALLDTTKLTSIGAIQIKGSGTESADKIYYNNQDLNPIIGTMASTGSSSISLITNSGTTTLTNTAGKSLYVANACPIIGIFENSTSNIIYNPATTTTGSIALDVKGDVFRGYSYNWIKAGDASWSAKSSSVTNLAKGDYKVTVNYLTDQCSKSRAFSVRPAIEEISVSNVAGSCNTNNSSITAKARRYFPNGSLIQFSIDSINWNDGTLSVVSSDSTYSYTFSNLYAGNYSLYYRIKTKPEYILKGTLVSITPSPMSISNLSLSVTPTGCLGETNGAITVNATATDGGTLSYYNIAAGTTYPSNPYTGLSAGSSYDVYVKNSTGCIAHAGTVNFPTVTSALTASASACYTESNTAGIKLTASGGISSYSYSIDDGSSIITSSTGTFASLNVDKSYTYSVEDANGCITTGTITTDKTTASLFKVDVTTNNILCSDNNVRGELIATPTGGVSPYSYYFDYGSNDKTFHDVETIGDWGNLSSGTYNIKVDDAAGCEVITTKTLSPVIPMPTPFYTKN